MGFYRYASAALLFLAVIGCNAKDAGVEEPNAGPVKNEGSAKSRDLIPKEMRPILEGEFIMGSNSKYAKEQNPQRTVYLDYFWIDRTEVSVAKYKECVDADTCTPPDTVVDGCNSARFPENNWGKPDRVDHPVNCVSWTQADTYCKWRGKRLPTEAEWEKAARGPKGHKYPWGNLEKPSCERAVIADGKRGCGKGTTWPVGSKEKGVSPYDVLNLAGNVTEWTADWFAPDHSKASLRNPKGPDSSDTKVKKGGSFLGSRFHSRAASRSGNGSRSSFAFVGFRCARDK